MVCVIQLLVCCGAVLAILCWRLIGGETYEQAKDWYQNAVSDSVIVLPDVSSDSSHG